MFDVNVWPKYSFFSLAFSPAPITLARTIATPAALGRFPRIDKEIARPP
jgi:hypothetical protein